MTVTTHPSSRPFPPNVSVTTPRGSGRQWTNHRSYYPENERRDPNSIVAAAAFTEGPMPPARTGTADVVIESGCTLLILVRDPKPENPSVTPRVIAGWNLSGSPVVVGDDGSLRTLLPTEFVADVVRTVGGTGGK